MLNIGNSFAYSKELSKDLGMSESRLDDMRAQLRHHVAIAVQALADSLEPELRQALGTTFECETDSASLSTAICNSELLEPYKPTLRAAFRQILLRHAMDYGCRGAASLVCVVMEPIYSVLLARDIAHLVIRIAHSIATKDDEMLEVFRSTATNVPCQIAHTIIKNADESFERTSEEAALAARDNNIFFGIHDVKVIKRFTVEREGKEYPALGLEYTMRPVLLPTGGYPNELYTTLVIYNLDPDSPEPVKGEASDFLDKEGRVVISAEDDIAIAAMLPSALDLYDLHHEVDTCSVLIAPSDDLMGC